MFSIAVIPLHLFSKVPDHKWIESSLFLFEQISVSIFTIEYLLRIWSNKKRLGFILSWEGVVDLVAILPFYFEKFGIGSSPEIFVLLRLLRILKFSVMYGKEQSEILSHNAAIKHGAFYLLKQEKIEQIVQKHPIIFLLGLLFPLFFTSTGLIIVLFTYGTPHETIWFAFSIVCFSLSIIFFYKAWLDYQYDVIYITNFRVILQQHELFGSETNGLTYDSITNVVPNNRGFFRWALGLGHIEIETANRDATLVFQNVQHPHKVVSKISENRIMHEQASEREMN